jgi:NAD(P)-dependent dehydrogenase (short-subunit alcohol dehydrogenase family)
MIDLKGHAALVTGSSKGVGRAIAEAYAAAGADVVIHGRSLGREAQEVMERCRACGVSASFAGGDLSDTIESTVSELFETAMAAQPNLDILVNNAGQYYDVPFEEMTLERFERTMQLNVTSAYFLAQRFARHWIAHHVAGRVLFIGSINGRQAEPVSTAYDISKGAVEMMVRTLTVALAPHGIRVNGLAPGVVLTPQTNWIVDRNPAKADWVKRHTPNRAIPHADVCGPGAVYLVSDAAWHVHGHMLMVDGGMSAWQYPEAE